MQINIWNANPYDMYMYMYESDILHNKAYLWYM